VALSSGGSQEGEEGKTHELLQCILNEESLMRTPKDAQGRRFEI